MISTQISRVSAVLLLIGGIAFLFASDVLLPRLVPAFPTEGAWIGQLLGAAWLGVAALNWSSKSVLLGGIYGRPVVLANGALYFITTLVLLRIVLRSGAPPALWLLFVPGAAPCGHL